MNYSIYNKCEEMDNNDIRKSLEKMRNLKKGIFEANDKKQKVTTPSNKDDVRNSVNIMRNLREFVEPAHQMDFPSRANDNIEVKDASQDRPELTTDLDMKQEEKKMQDFFSDLNVHVKFKYLDVFSDSVFVAGSINDEVQFTFTVTPEEEDNGVDIDYLESFNSEDEENQRVLDKIEAYYSTFYKYWEDNVLTKE